MNQFHFLALTAIVISSSGYGDDAVIQLAPGGSFIVKDSAGTHQLMTVNQNGVLSVNGKAIDFTPPEAEVTISEIATQFETPFSVLVSDNVGLGYYMAQGNLAISPFGGNIFPFATPFEPDIKSKVLTNQMLVHLNDDPAIRTYTFVDTSGNSTNTQVKVLSPTTALKPGNYDIIGNLVTPAGFTCSKPPIMDGQTWDPLLRVTVYDYTNAWPTKYWSASEGFWASFEVGGQILTSLGSESDGFPDTRFPLDNTKFSIESIAPIGKWKGEFNIVSSSPPRITGSIIMSCNVDLTWIDGTPLEFTAVYSQ